MSDRFSAGLLRLNEADTMKILEIFIEQEVRRTGLTKVILGLSGGVDSALSTYLAVRALGPENVHVVMMPYKTSNPDSLTHAELIVSNLGVSFEVFDITETANAFFTASEDSLDALERISHESSSLDKVRRGNAMARIRMITLYDRSQQRGALVIGTSNKTESLLGYTTLFGDNASAINPIGDLYKTQVWQLSEAAGVPSEIVGKAPSADLWAGQTDEEEMGLSYREVDMLLFHMIDQRLNKEELIELGFEPDYIDRIHRIIVRNQFKRRPPLIGKIGPRTINVDFRYPRDWGT